MSRVSDKPYFVYVLSKGHGGDWRTDAAGFLVPYCADGGGGKVPHTSVEADYCRHRRGSKEKSRAAAESAATEDPPSRFLAKGEGIVEANVVKTVCSVPVAVANADALVAVSPCRSSRKFQRRLEIPLVAVRIKR